MDENKEIKISEDIVKVIMGRDIGFIESAVNSAVCHDCILLRRNISMEKITGYYLDGDRNIILKGVCSLCGGYDCLSYIESSTDPEKLRAAERCLNDKINRF